MSEIQEVEVAAPRRRINFGFDKYSGIYVWALLVLIFALWIPDLFLQTSTVKQVLTFQAISAIVALGLILPVAAGAFDLTFQDLLKRCLQHPQHSQCGLDRISIPHPR